MIIVCPECETKYDVKAEAITVDGRTMKCHSCGNKWFQEGVSFQDILDDAEPADVFESGANADTDTDFDDVLSNIEKTLDEEVRRDLSGDKDAYSDLYGDDGADVEIDFHDRQESESEGEPSHNGNQEYDEDELDILKVLQGAIEGEEGEEASDQTSKGNKKKIKPSKVKAPRKKAKPTKKTKIKPELSKAALATGVFAGVLLFFILFVLCVFLKDTIVSSFPASKPVYAALGFKMPVAGEGLVFDQVVTSWNDNQLNIEGQIVNLTSDKSLIPYIEVTFQDAQGHVIDRSGFQTTSDVVDGESVEVFSYDFQVLEDTKAQTQAIGLAFLPIQE